MATPFPFRLYLTSGTSLDVSLTATDGPYPASAAVWFLLPDGTRHDAAIIGDRARWQIPAAAADAMPKDSGITIVYSDINYDPVVVGSGQVLRGWGNQRLTRETWARAQELSALVTPERVQVDGLATEDTMVNRVDVSIRATELAAKQTKAAVAAADTAAQSGVATLAGRTDAASNAITAAVQSAETAAAAHADAAGVDAAATRLALTDAHTALLAAVQGADTAARSAATTAHADALAVAAAVDAQTPAAATTVATQVQTSGAQTVTAVDAAAAAVAAADTAARSAVATTHTKVDATTAAVTGADTAARSAATALQAAVQAVETQTAATTTATAGSNTRLDTLNTEIAALRAGQDAMNAEVTELNAKTSDARTDFAAGRVRTAGGVVQIAAGGTGGVQLSNPAASGKVVTLERYLLTATSTADVMVFIDATMGGAPSLRSSFNPNRSLEGAPGQTTVGRLTTTGGGISGGTQLSSVFRLTTGEQMALDFPVVLLPGMSVAVAVAAPSGLGGSSITLYTNCSWSEDPA